MNIFFTVSNKKSLNMKYKTQLSNCAHSDKDECQGHSAAASLHCLYTIWSHSFVLAGWGVRERVLAPSFGTLLPCQLDLTTLYLFYCVYSVCDDYICRIYIVLVLHTFLFVFVCYSKESDVIKSLFTISLYLEILSNSLLQAQTFEK